MFGVWTSNPEADAERYYTDLEDEAEKCRKCSICGEPIRPGMDYFNIFGHSICTECVEDTRRTEDYDY